MSDLSTCPFCGCGVKSWLNDEHTRCDWLCGSFKHGPEPYQFPDGSCRVNELELEVDGWKAAHLDMSGDMLKVEADNAALRGRLHDCRSLLAGIELHLSQVDESGMDAIQLHHIRSPRQGAVAMIELLTHVLSRPGGDEYRAAKALADFILADFNETQVCPHCDPQEPDGHFEECPLDAYSKAKQEANPDGTP